MHLKIYILNPDEYKLEVSGGGQHNPCEHTRETLTSMFFFKEKQESHQ